MRDADLRQKLLSVLPPDELEAERRSWNVVRAAWETREALPPERRLRPILAAALFATAAVLGAVALTPAGGAVGGWIKDAFVGQPDARPALDSLPAPGSLLVSSAQGVWVVRPDGSKRRLGDYRQASWSPRGLFVAATGGHQLVALEPDGDVRWTVSRRQSVSDARWMPGTGFRVAYRSGRSLRVVGGDGEGDRLLAPRVAPVAPAWQPVEEHVLAYVDRAGRIHLVGADDRRERWQTRRARPAHGLEWSRDGKWLLAWSPNLIRVYGSDGQLDTAIRVPKRLYAVLAATFKPGTRKITNTVYEKKTGKSSVFVGSIERFSGLGRFTKLTWSPDRG
ncbi:MAG TPA: hypothetical protein VES61_05365, partial [Gaiellaceae bacterium]|nr:hypothetical protein [Gaiellaceae bacterium]